ncbi:MAG: cytochrome c [Thermodesulfovibrionales bacterium]|nr:cytochrome c [Thermodesulfovibrionales bacterium]
MEAKMYKTWILIILLVTALFTSSGYTETEKKGKSLFSSKGCVTCHKIQGIGEGKGIDLTNVGGRLDSTAIKNKIKVCMPKLNISAKDAEALAVYLSTLKSITASPSKEKPVSTLTATTVDIKWETTNPDLVTAVNYLINNKGKEIKLAGKKHTITGKEGLDVEITVLDCCDEESFRKYISTLGVVKDVKFPTFHATLPADAIPKIDKQGEVTGIKFEPKARELWMNAIKQ